MGEKIPCSWKQTLNIVEMPKVIPEKKNPRECFHEFVQADVIISVVK